jgi:hypothetical protein
MDAIHGFQSAVGTSRSRGVVLIVILGMLAVLALIGIAFTTYSAQEETSSRNFQMKFQNPRVDLDPNVVFVEAINQLINDTNNPHSAVRGHSLMRRMVGNDNEPFNGPGDLGDTSTVPATPIDFNFIYNTRPPETVWGLLPSPPNPMGSMGWIRAGGFDADYTYPDFNNMYLAAIRSDGTVLVPSFHRPGYMDATDWTLVANTPGRGRRIILRPRGGFNPGPDGIPGNADDIPMEHPFFPATSPNGLDVDNMGLGRADSVWIDIGFPVQQTLSGRRFKPLVAFLVIDLDGKLNLNVHGNLTADKIDATGVWRFPDLAGDGTPDSHGDIAPGVGAGGVAHGGLQSAGGGAILDVPFNDLSLGQGVSVAEVNLQNPFNRLFTGLVPTTLNNYEYRWLLEGQWRPGPDATFGTADDIFVPGRWGEVNLLTTPTMPRAGATYLGAGSPQYADDTMPAYFSLRGNLLEGLPYNAGGIFRTPGDLDGTGALAIDTLGRRYYLPNSTQMGVPRAFGWGGPIGWPAIFAGPQIALDTLDDATEFNPYESQAVDAAFVPREMELLYRYDDVDGSSLAQPFGAATRLSVLAPSLFDVTNANNRRRRHMLTTESWDVTRPNHPTIVAWETNSAVAANPSAGNGIFPFLNPRIAANRPFIAALPEALRAGRRLPITPQFPTSPTPPPLPSVRKYEFARALYMIMWANSVAPGPTPPTPEQCKRIAQWAVNAVEFSDTESGGDEIMMPFVYDINPYFDIDGNGNGWDVSMDPLDTTTGGTERAIVWGTEAPRLVVNETFAYEDPPGTMNFWVELYNPTPYPVELDGPNHTYQLVIDDRGPPPNPVLPGPPPPPPVQGPFLAPDPREGEPQVTTNNLDFRTPAAGSVGGTIIAPFQRLIVGPAGAMPAAVGGGPFGTPNRFVPAVAFAPPPPAPVAPITDYRVYLRRLANPYQPNDAAPYPNASNPYITVDALDVYAHPNADMMPDPVSGVVVARSLERRSLNVAYRAHDPGGAAPAGPAHSIGDSSPADDVTPFNSTQATTDVNDDGIPDPWPMFVFNDRPFSSPMELLLVPAVSPQHLTTTFFFPMPAGTTDPYNPVAGQINNNAIVTGSSPNLVERTQPYRELPQSGIGAPSQQYLYGHLLNFFREDTVGAAFPAVPRPGYYRLFEYIEVPSRFNGSTDPSPSITAGEMSGRGRRERDPGKLNINTIWEQETFQGGLNNHPFSLDASAIWIQPATQIPTFETPNAPESATSMTTGQAYANLTSELYRRVLTSIANPGGDVVGDAETPPRLFTANDRPFRSFAQGFNGSVPPATPNAVPISNIQSTFFRGLKENAATQRTPLFEDDRGRRAGAAIPYNPPGLTPTAPTRNDLLDYPYYRWQLMQKMSNVFTTRSNVFAVWMTVGFFEVVDENPDRLVATFGLPNAPPQLGPEVNSDIGQNIRHRAFFIIDRSRATGYNGPPKSSSELQDMLSQVLIHSRIIE